ncbi:hypothetical protein [Cobetia amphilecti]|uniref:hypothetical protein n=1 Tax=Cobetia amphilecti TaxID=1055104 RepID=UPI0024485A96|nr:hypothetical protein [Cobetia litoralis]MDH2420074.1 hypothetical protein [Cobetia litoralis]MDH2422529.1 hypothetical protein [Cobetia litoralis]
MKRFNFTGRKKIFREDVSIKLCGGFDERPVVNVSVNLADYSLSPDSIVFLEAQSRTRFSREKLGGVSPSVRKNAISLEQFDDAEGLSFRIKVVDECRGLLEAIAENIKPYDKDDNPADHHKSILPVASADLLSYGALWRVDYDDQNATLQIEQELGSKDQVVRSLLFRGFILPAAMRQILAKIVYGDWDPDLSDPEELSTRWLLFVKQIGGDVPEVNTDDHEDWLDDAVRYICNRIGVRNQIIEEFDSGVWK